MFVLFYLLFCDFIKIEFEDFRFTFITEHLPGP